MTTGRINQVNILLISSFFLWGSLSPPDDSESRTVYTKVQSDCIPIPPVVLGILRSAQFHPTQVWTNPSHIQVHTTRIPPWCKSDPQRPPNTPKENNHTSATKATDIFRSLQKNSTRSIECKYHIPMFPSAISYSHP